MEDQIPLRRRVALGVAVVAGAAGLLAAVPASAGAPAPSPEPEEYESNLDCADIDLSGGDWNELKVDPGKSGDYADGDGQLKVSITVTDNDETGPTFAWTANIPVSTVLVKGGNVGGNRYDYDPASLGDDGLHAPMNPSEKWAGLSHITFCYEDTTPPTTEPEKPTTTTTVPGETTTTTVPGETTTTVAGETTTTVPTVAPAPAPKAQPVVATPTFTG